MNAGFSTITFLPAITNTLTWWKCKEGGVDTIKTVWLGRASNADSMVVKTGLEGSKLGDWADTNPTISWLFANSAGIILFLACAPTPMIQKL
jgi:hypothetical protein